MPGRTFLYALSALHCAFLFVFSSKFLVANLGRAARLEKWRDRLHLWQVFFSNPYEWWDNRKQKLYPGSPDFKHKDTGEALWLSPNDPPWIKKQLQLLDSEMGLGEPVDGRTRLSKWEYDA